MKKLIILLATVLSTVMTYGQDKFCDPALAEEINNYISKNGGEWLKDFNIYQPKSPEQNKTPETKYSIVLTAGNVYRFILISSLKYQGIAQLTIEDKSGKRIANLKTKSKNIPEAIDTKITSTDAYKISVYFTDGIEGCANFTICYLKKRQIRIKIF